MRKPAGQKVEFELAGEPGREVFVAGMFNVWDPKHTRMKENAKKGVYRTRIALPPGRHEYRFVVDGVWQTDPKCSEKVPNGHGAENSVIQVAG